VDRPQGRRSPVGPWKVTGYWDALAWQVAFLLIARDEVRFRPFMLLGALEKVSFGGAAVVLYLQGRLAPVVLAGGVVDLLLAVLFVLAWRAVAPRPA